MAGPKVEWESTWKSSTGNSASSPWQQLGNQPCPPVFGMMNPAMRGFLQQSQSSTATMSSATADPVQRAVLEHAMKTQMQNQFRMQPPPMYHPRPPNPTYPSPFPQLPPRHSFQPPARVTYPTLPAQQSNNPVSQSSGNTSVPKPVQQPVISNADTSVHPALQKKNDVGAQKPPKKEQQGFPPDLMEYVNKCFAACVVESEKDIMEKKLKQLIQDVFTSGLKKDWSKEPLLTAYSQPSMYLPDMIKPFTPRSVRGRGLRGAKVSGTQSRGAARGRYPTYNRSGNSRWGTRSSRSRSRSLSSSSSRSQSRSPSPLPRGKRGPYNSKLARRQSLMKKPRFRPRANDMSDDSDYDDGPSSRIGSAVKPVAHSSVTRRHQSASSTSSEDSTPTPTPRKFTPKKGNKKATKKTSRFYTKGGAAIGEYNPLDPAQKARLDKRKKRFADEDCKQSGGSAFDRLGIKRVIYNDRKDSEDDVDMDTPIVGTCQDIEKRFFRLTAAPNPSAVRPPEVLRRSLDHVLSKWSSEKARHESLDDLKSGYTWTLDQLKSIRQDLTIQRIKDEFAIECYESHARIAIDLRDFTEYAQCQSQLIELYKSNPGKGHPTEFKAYRILYSIFINKKMEIASIRRHMTPAEQSDALIIRALQFFDNWLVGNFHRYFRLSKDAPEMFRLFLQRYLFPQLRPKILRVIMKGHKLDLKLPVSYVQSALQFNTTAECRTFLSEFSVVYADGDSATLIDCKKSVPNMEAALKAQ